MWGAPLFKGNFILEEARYGGLRCFAIERGCIFDFQGSLHFTRSECTSITNGTGCTRTLDTNREITPRRILDRRLGA